MKASRESLINIQLFPILISTDPTIILPISSHHWAAGAQLPLWRLSELIAHTFPLPGNLGDSEETSYQFVQHGTGLFRETWTRLNGSFRLRKAYFGYLGHDVQAAMRSDLSVPAKAWGRKHGAGRVSRCLNGDKAKDADILSGPET